MLYLVIPTKESETLWQHLSHVISSVSKQFLSVHCTLRRVPEAPIADYCPIGMWVGNTGVILRFWSCYLRLPSDMEKYADTFGRELSGRLAYPHLKCIEYDTKWGYEFRQGQRNSVFCVDKLYWPADLVNCADVVVDVKALSELFGIAPERISRYLRIWDDVPQDDLKAYPTDRFACGDWQQVEDFAQTLIGGVTECYRLEIVATPDSLPKFRASRD